MKITKPIIFCGLILGVLSTTQTDAFARWRHHRHGEFHGNFATLENRDRAKALSRLHDDSKYHAVLDHSREENDGSRFEKEEQSEKTNSQDGYLGLILRKHQ